MSTFRNIALFVLLVLAAASVPASAQDKLQGWRPSVMEATLLPKFCWKQFMGDKFRGPEFEIPRATCGYGTNHYCPGLVLLNRANRTFDQKMKRGYLWGARGQVEYTVKALEKFPRCPIRGEAQRTLHLIQGEMSLLR